MAPDHVEDDLVPEQVSSESTAESGTRGTRPTRRRTKTGCLTCRKRRIKCGEEHPVCKNCIKSRRQCEGYKTPIIFRPVWNDSSIEPIGSGGAQIIFQNEPIPGPSMPVVDMPPGAGDPRQPGLPSRPPPSFIPGFSPQEQPVARFEQYTTPFTMPTTQPVMPDPIFGQHFSLLGPHHYPTLHPGSIPPSVMPVGPQMQPATLIHTGPSQQSISPEFARGEISPSFVRVPAISPTARAALGYPGHYPDTPVSPLQPHTFAPQPLMQNPNVEIPGYSRPWVEPSTAHSHQTPRAYSMSHPLVSQPWMAGMRATGLDTTASVDYSMSATSAGQQFQAFQAFQPNTPLTRSAPTTPYGYEQEAQIPPRMSPTYFLGTAAVQTQDDDYYDVLSQEEMEDNTSATRAPDFPHALSNLLATTQISVSGSQTRRYDTFLYHGILNHYRFEWVASPLRNPATARVFAHFISVTGPMLSLYERHPKNTSVLFTKGAIPFSQQGLWTYTMPMAALHHQGLLHAMLALASLHIARLQGASTTPSMQHYAWALKRIHHCVGNPKKRLSLTTIAASMLLGFYEVMTAEHMKWSMHLSGSKQLYIETDFEKMTQEFRRMKVDKLARDQLPAEARASFAPCHSQDDLLDQMPDVDERVVSTLVGREVRYGNHGSVQMDQDQIPRELDLSEYASLRDLYWWYCKQDVIQSILSGNPLLMDFSRWHNCPPRAPLGRADAVHGSFDHLVLILVRIADFVARDRARKLRQIEANGGQWQPASGINIPRTQPRQHGHPPTPVSGGLPDQTESQLPNPGMAMPPFYGMTPQPQADVRMPASYMPAPATSSPLGGMDTPLETNPQAETDAALIEHEQIRAALLAFSTSLGETFEPLTSEYQPTMQTPFGTAVFYRSYDIGCLWALYYMAMIIAIRSHPYMPPAAHAAAGVAAHETAFFANEIGRITAGIVPGSPEDQLNPSLGAALNESCLPSFFAAVQYREPAQRHFTVTRIFNIARRTGWGSAELIANGCETAWIRAAEAGRGPPYERVVRVHSSNPDDPRLNGSWEGLDPNMVPDMRDELDRRLVRVNANARLNWAIGVMGTEMDLETMPTAL